MALIVFIDMVGIGLIVPVLPGLLEEITGESLDRTAEIGGWLLFAYALMQFTFAPVIGGLSDRFGRRPVLLVTLFMLGIDYAIMAWAPTLFWLFIGRILSGIMGASWAAANSCIADVASPDERGKLFGILGAAGASGFVIGPAIGGVLGEFGVRLPFIAAAVLGIGGAILGYFFLRETLPVERRRTFTMARANPLGTLIQMSRNPIVLGFIIVIFFMQLAGQSQMSVWSYHTQLVFNWSELDIGLSVTLFGIIVAFVQGGLTGRVIAAIGPERTAILGFLLAMPAYYLFAFAQSGWFMIVGIVFGGLGGLTFPALQQMMSERVAEDAQGELQGAIASAMSITSIIGPLIMTATFGAYADDTGLFFPGAPYLLAAMISLIGLLIAARNIRRMGPKSKPVRT
ncbi:TCR/Tet family MFS transporter [uncultured Erythrobacter sp.]|uniref:TCR/Tet family MFS transporter n=1 Tax=uncultured Erythrobacter sp. TaxID=263913 RepID=UPI00262A6F1C|nr:TCR/Tet family MFS transporter [uncultured Erythrobacter sp.]